MARSRTPKQRAEYRALRHSNAQRIHTFNKERPNRVRETFTRLKSEFEKRGWTVR